MCVGSEILHETNEMELNEMEQEENLCLLPPPPPPPSLFQLTQHVLGVHHMYCIHVSVELHDLGVVSMVGSWIRAAQFNPLRVGQSAGFWRVVARKMYARALGISI